MDEAARETTPKQQGHWKQKHEGGLKLAATWSSLGFELFVRPQDNS